MPRIARGNAHGLNLEKNRTMEIDLHGFHPTDIDMTAIVRQAWEAGLPHLTFIHGHGRNRGLSPGFVNTNTGYLGLTVRRALRQNELKQWIKSSTINCKDSGYTTVKLKPNPTPTRSAFDSILLPERRYPQRGPR